jgi:hypothetical protein
MLPHFPACEAERLTCMLLGLGALHPTAELQGTLQGGDMLLSMMP